MDDTFVIYVDRLHEGQEEKIEERTSPGFLDLEDDDLAFNSEVYFAGKAYLADKQLIMDLKVATVVTLPCSICNNVVDVDLKLDKVYIVEDLANINSGKYDFSVSLREAILLEAPSFVECNKGLCPERQKNKKYIRDDSKDIYAYHPFADLK